MKAEDFFNGKEIKNKRTSKAANGKQMSQRCCRSEKYTERYAETRSRKSTNI